jgi:carboxypeptidase C (cathepsin A)
VNGYHDVATPFLTTEQDLARLASPNVQVRNYIGGHMTYLTDASRAQMKADLAAWYAAP